MRRQLQWLLILFSLTCSMESLASASTQKDPCTSLNGFWTGDFKDAIKNCTCTTYYQVYQAQESVTFDLMQFNCSGECNTPPDLQGICRGAYFQSSFDGGFNGAVGENMVILKNGNYSLKLYR